MTDPNRYARLGPIARALVDDHDQIALAEMLVKADDELERARRELADRDATDSTDAAAGSYASRQATLTITVTAPNPVHAVRWAGHVRDLVHAEFDGSMGLYSFIELEPGGPARATPDAPPTSSNTPDKSVEERVRTFIESEMYEYRERTMWWPETGGITEEIARLATRGAMEILDQQPDTPTWTPPPPGSTAEQLPETLLALIRDRLPDYTSTACQTADTVACAACYPGSGIPRPQYDEIREHAERLHNRCRINHKFTGQLCACGCHPEEQQPYPPIGLTGGGQP